MARALTSIPRRRLKARQLRRFTGSFDQLCRVISATGVAGSWENMPAGHLRFVCISGAVFNWWPTTGTFNVQGPSEEALRFQVVLANTVDRLRTATPKPLTYGGALMPRQTITKLRLTAARKYHLKRAARGAKGQSFESAVFCREEDAKRVRSISEGISRPNRHITPRDARRLVKKLTRPATQRRGRTMASCLDMRWLRNRVFSQLWRVVARCPGRVTTFTAIKRGWEFSPEALDEVHVGKLLASFLSDLNRRGAADASGWLIAFIHGEFETPAGIYRLHLHGVAAEGMIEVVDGLRKGAKYRYRPNDTVRFRVRIDRKPLQNLPHPLTYCFKSYWPRKHIIVRMNGKRRTRRHMRIPEPYHSQVLAFLDRHHPSNFVVLKHLQVAGGQLMRTKRIGD